MYYPEQVCLEPFLEGGETVSVSDGGGELIPPLGGQTGEELVLGILSQLYLKFIVNNNASLYSLLDSKCN